MTSVENEVIAAGGLGTLAESSRQLEQPQSRLEKLLFKLRVDS